MAIAGRQIGARLCDADDRLAGLHLFTSQTEVGGTAPDRSPSSPCCGGLSNQQRLRSRPAHSLFVFGLSMESTIVQSARQVAAEGTPAVTHRPGFFESIYGALCKAHPYRQPDGASFEQHPSACTLRLSRRRSPRNRLSTLEPIPDRRAKAFMFQSLIRRQGKIEPARLAGEVVQPSWVTVHPNHRFLYAVSELGNNGREQASISSFAIDRRLGRSEGSQQSAFRRRRGMSFEYRQNGKDDRRRELRHGQRRHLRAGNGRELGERKSLQQHHGSSVTRRQTGPPAHAVVFSADNRFFICSRPGS